MKWTHHSGIARLISLDVSVSRINSVGLSSNVNIWFLHLVASCVTQLWHDEAGKRNLCDLLFISFSAVECAFYNKTEFEQTIDSLTKIDRSMCHSCCKWNRVLWRVSYQWSDGNLHVCGGSWVTRVLHDFIPFYCGQAPLNVAKRVVCCPVLYFYPLCP